MTLAYLKLFADQAEELTMLDDAARGRFVLGLLLYATQGIEPEFEGVEKLLWPSFRRSIDAAAAQVEASSANGAKGGRPRKNKTQQNPTEGENNPTETQQNPTESKKKPIQVHVQVQEQVHVQSPSNEGEGAKAPNAPARGRFTPPTAEEVAAYAQEKGLALDVERFVDFYASKGWKVGNASMKDWKAAVRNWARDDKARGSPVRDCPPTQDDVYFYARQLGWDAFTTQFAREFLQHYTARNWTLNGTALTDWRPLLKTWWSQPGRNISTVEYDPLPY